MRFAALLSLLLMACGTLAEGDGGGENLPSRGILPFDKLEAPEDDDSSILPFVVAHNELDLDEPTAIVTADGIDLYLQVEEETRTLIQRASSRDGISFEALETVLEPELDWEESWIGAPSVVRFGEDLLLFYLGGVEERAVGLARSADGNTWARESEAIFEPEMIIASPCVVSLNGKLVMFHSVLTENEDEDLVPTAIAYATSTDGTSWTEAGQALSVGTGCVNDDGAEVRCWDNTYVTSPGVRVSHTSTGRTVVDMWYTGGVADNSNIGFAGSFDDLGFERYALNPILDDRGPESSAFVVLFQNRLLMYYSDEHDDRRAIALATN